MSIYYAETAGLSSEVTVYSVDEGRTVASITADGHSLDAKEEALSRAGYGREGLWVATEKLPVSRYLVAVSPVAVSPAALS